jgi:hypothetical protein
VLTLDAQNVNGRSQYETDGFRAEIFDLPPYSPELAPSDFHLFFHLKKHLAGKNFDDDDEVQVEVMTWF